ncbi:MAG: zf-TFIIB domain-containing protein [Candidatus Saccharimonadota bacterium]
MNCPIDSTPLTMSERQGIEIDYCPSCRGVWLDRGELDKIIERSSAAPSQHTPASNHHGQQSHQSHHNDTRHNQPHYKKKRESFLGDLFDF